MKELVVGDIAIYTEDDNSWDDLIKVVKKANKACLESAKKESGLEKMRKRWRKKSVLPFLVVWMVFITSEFLNMVGQ